MTRASTFPPRWELEERIDQARELLHEDAVAHARRLELSEAELAEVLDDLVEWFGGRPVRPRPVGPRRCGR